MGSFLFGDEALAGLKVLSVVDRKDRRMFALERVGRSGVRGSVGPHARERPHPPGVPARTHRWKVSGVGLWIRLQRRWRNGSFVFHMAWRMTASLRATVTFAFLKPAPLAILRPQAFREENRFAASECIGGFIEAGWVSLSPRFEMRLCRPQGKQKHPM